MDIRGIYADNVEIVPSGGGSLDVDLEGVDLSQLIHEIGADVILEDIGVDEVKEWLKEKEDEQD